MEDMGNTVEVLLWKTWGILKKRLIAQSEVVLTDFLSNILKTDLSSVQTKLEIFSSETNDSVNISLKTYISK